MDAATPFRRWFCAAILAAGCQSLPETEAERNEKHAAEIARQRAENEGAYLAKNPGVKPPTVRPQMPTEPVAGLPVTPVAASVPATGTPRIKVVAVVGSGNIVTDEEVWESVRQRVQDYISLVDGPGGKQIVKDDAKEKALYGEELRRVVERELILDEMYARLKKAGKANVIDEIKEFSGKAADRQLREYKKHYKAESDDEFRSILHSQGLTLPVVRRQIERQMMAEEYVRSMLKEKGKTIGLAEVRAYYDTHADEFRTEDRVKWLDIFVSFNKFPTPRAAYDHALAVQQQAAAGADFPALSKEHDHGISGMQKGEGNGTKRGEIKPAEVEATVWSLAAGQVSGLIETPAGYHIVKVAEREIAGVRPFDDKTQTEVRRRIQRQMQEREYKRLVEDLWRRGVVKVMDDGK